MFCLARVFSLFVVLLATPLWAAILVQPISESPIDCDEPSVAQSPLGYTMVAWRDADGHVWTQRVTTFPAAVDDRSVPYDHGAGTSPRVVWSWFGFMIVWVHDTKLCYNYDMLNEFPDPAQIIETGLDLSGAVLDVHGAVDSMWEVTWIAFDAPAADERRTVYLQRVVKSGPAAELEVIAENLDWLACPQVAQVPGAALMPQPRVYYLRDTASLAYRTRRPDGAWLDESILPVEAYGTEFDASGDATGAQGILSLGPQPTCPCNVIHATLQSPAGEWGDPEMLPVPYLEYDWPMSPCVHVDSQGRMHAFWSQLGSDSQLTPHRRDLEYWVRNTGGWTDRGQDLDAHEAPGLGDRVAMDLTATDQPVFAWTVKDTVAGVPQPRQIMLARPTTIVAAPDGAMPARPLALAVWPNPFHPQLTIAGTARAGEPVALTVHDLAGRRVASFAVRPGADGHFAARWDGRDASGRAAPSGVYLVRLAAGAETVARRVVLAR